MLLHLSLHIPLQVWQQEATDMLAKMDGVVELKALESLVSQASKLPVSLSDAKEMFCQTSAIVLNVKCEGCCHDDTLLDIHKVLKLQNCIQWLCDSPVKTSAPMGSSQTQSVWEESILRSIYLQ